MHRCDAVADGGKMIYQCNCPSCRGEGPDDNEAPEPTDEFIKEWIDKNHETITEECADKIQAAWETYLEGQKEEAAISRAESREEARKERLYDR